MPARRRRRTTIEMRHLVRDTAGRLDRNRDLSERLERELETVQEQVARFSDDGGRLDAEAQDSILASLEQEERELERQAAVAAAARAKLLAEGQRLVSEIEGALDVAGEDLHKMNDLASNLKGGRVRPTVQQIGEMCRVRTSVLKRLALDARRALAD